MSNPLLIIVVLSLISVITAGACVVMIWYTKILLKDVSLVSTDMQNLKAILHNYCEHVESVYEMEMFYGDETLQNLIRHSKAVVDEIKTNDYSFSTIQEDGDDKIYAEEENENQEVLLYKSP